MRVAVPVVDPEEAAVIPDRVRREHHAALRPGRHDVRGQAAVGDDLLDPGHRAGAQRIDPLVRRGRGDRAEHGARPGQRQRVAVERADHLVLAAGHVLHHLGGAADRGDGHAAAERLRQADQVRAHSGQRGGAARPCGEPSLDLVEGEQRAVGVQQVRQRRQVPRLRQDDAGVHHDRLDDHAGYLAAVLVEQPRHALGVVEAGDQGQVRDRGWDARACAPGRRRPGRG